MKLTATRSAIYITLCVLAMASMASADSPTPVTACGTVITVAGKYSLANDLVGCISRLSTGGGTGVLVAPPSPGATGLSDVTISDPGVITNFTVRAGIAFMTTSSSTVQGVTCTGNDFGFSIGFNSTNNTFKGDTANGNQAGFGVYSSYNVFKGNDASNKGMGFVVLANGNELHGNTASANSQDGIQVLTSSTANTLRGNTALVNNTSGGTFFYDLGDDNKL